MSWYDSIHFAAGIIISLALSYIPGLHDRWLALPSDWKRVVLLIALAAASVLLWLARCEWGLIVGGPSCDDGAVAALRGFIEAVIASQAAYAVSPAVRSKP